MAGRGRKAGPPPSLCAYFVEIKECDGVTTAPVGSTFLVKKCILDKIFSINPDIIAVSRSDGSTNIEFVEANWEGLKKGLKTLTEIKSCENEGVQNPMSALNDVVNAVIVSAEEDTYHEKKIIYFADLGSYVLDQEETTEIAEKLHANDIFISIILPNKMDMSEIQLQNSKLIKSIFNTDKYDSISCVYNADKAQRQILNTQSKKAVRPSSWNVQFEISPELLISVAGYSLTRKNNTQEMKRVLIKQSEADFRSNNVPMNSDNSPSSTERNVGSGDNSTNQKLTTYANSDSKTVVVEQAKSVLEKEHTWKENDGTVVSEDDMGKAYYFGDKLIPFNELEHEGSYQSGPKCLKLLAFCPKSNIRPSLLTGDGVTLFYSKKDDIESEAKLKALVKAMIKTDRIAIVRRVYSKNSRVTIGTMVPDGDRECLMFSEICFADDISVPQFPYLIKPEELTDEVEDTLEVNEKEALIDELIGMKTLDGFQPSEGPGDPAVKVLREVITRKIVDDSAHDLECEKLDLFDIFFQRLFAEDTTALSEKILKNFPLQKNKMHSERLAGKNIFRKRAASEESPENDTVKKLKEDDPIKEDKTMEIEEDAAEFDDLLDEL